jgi:oxalate decarboxylase
MFRSDRFADISLRQWMALTPPELVREHLRLGEDAASALRGDERPVVG